MDTNAPKTPAGLPFAAWQALSPAEAARTVHQRVAALPDHLRRAAVAWLCPERELAQALGPIASGSPGETGLPAPAETAAPPLHGVPYVLKDLFDLAGVPTRAGSTFLEQVRPAPIRDGAFPRRLRALGAACAGKTHLVEFAAGLFGDNAHYGDCPHPQFPDRVAGGSSSGSAALVAAGVVPLAVGTDTGGSVRVPAAFCGLYGFRLTPADALIRDAFPLSPTMDTAGWFTGNADDLLTTWRALVAGGANRPDEPAGAAPSAARPMESPDPLRRGFRGCYLPAHAIGIPFDPAAAAAADRAAASFAGPADRATTAALLSAWSGAIEAYSVIALHEAHAIHRDWLAPYREHYEPGIWQRFSDGGNYAAGQLMQAWETLARVRAGWRDFFSAYDFLVLPCAPFPALRRPDCTPEARRQLLTLTTPASLGGLAVLTLPVGLPAGLTAGLQVILPDPDSAVVPWILGKP